ncbi:MAG: nuclear transport factor 2 family protein [Winogradskyella sp.]|uniref:YybH family protein n=1 Tax=Winogradskyella sp. TaxID=1883156 RepID=UPI00180EA2F0|nr:nuclear transport factor 2 family protein [Winogradskyella sp.]
MRNKLVIILLLLLCATPLCSAQSIEDLKAVNKVWSKFYNAFETLDYSLMAQIHSDELVRVSGGKRIIDYDTYITNYKSRFKQDKLTKQTNTITLRFFERLNNGRTASERGIYKLTKNQGTKNERSYYGQFHVILKKIDGHWKITMDYDSSEGGTIGEDNFNKALAIDDLETFVKN